MKTSALVPLSFLFLASLCGCATAPHGCDTLIAHRGESADAPENTLPAYRMAVDRGFGFECDIYRSKDGRLFTFHDTNLKRTSNGKIDKRCVDAGWETEISQMNVGGWGKWKGSRFDPTRPALLEEVLALARPGRKIYVEVKGNENHAAVAWVRQIRETVAREPKATPETVLFICFDRPTCAALKRAMPAYRVYWLTDSWKRDRNGKKTGVRPPSEIVRTLREIGADGVDIGFDPAVIDAAYVKAVKDAGFSFHVWTVDDPETARKAFAAGAETVTTNRAKYLLEALSDGTVRQ